MTFVLVCVVLTALAIAGVSLPLLKQLGSP